MDREFIIQNINITRSTYGKRFDICPFGESCEMTCERIFNGYEKQEAGIWFNKCPCQHYSEEYVKQRMKELFPELY